MSMSLQAWADAMAIDKQLGSEAETHVVDQIRRYTMDGNDVEAARWHRIGRALNAIREAKVPSPDTPGQLDFHGPQPVRRQPTPGTSADR